MDKSTMLSPTGGSSNMSTNRNNRSIFKVNINNQEQSQAMLNNSAVKVRDDYGSAFLTEAHIQESERGSVKDDEEVKKGGSESVVSPKSSQ
jgi:hypothetical protein